MFRWPTSKARLDSAWAAQWEDCVGSAGCDRQRFPRRQGPVCSSRSRSFYDPLGIHLEILLILMFAVQQSSAKLGDQSRPYERRKCTHPSAKDKAQRSHSEQAILSKTVICMKGGISLVVSAVSLHLHWGSSSRWTPEERTWAFDSVGRDPAVCARARGRAVARRGIFSGHRRPAL